MSEPTPGPWSFLEDGQTETEYNRCRPLTICGGPNNDDIANVFSRDDATVSISREEAIANARLFAAAREMLEALQSIDAWVTGDYPVDSPEGRALERARAAIAKAVTP